MPRRPAAGETTRDNRELEQRASDQSSVGLNDDSGRESTDVVDFAFLATQTFDDADLERELLELFIAQARRIVPTLPQLPGRQQADTAHLLKGSARGIGAWAAADAADAYEAADALGRASAYEMLVTAFAAVEAAITAHLALLSR